MKNKNDEKPKHRTLLFVPLPLEDESPTSIFKRAVRKNGCRREELLHNHFPPFNRTISCLSQNSPIAIFFSMQAGDNSEQLLSGFYKSTILNPRRSSLIIQGIHVPAKAIRFRHNAFCSECYLEGKELYLKDIRLMSACPIHLRKYITSCPNCGIKLCWFQPFNQRCRCGFELISESISASHAEPEIFLANIWQRKDQATFNRLIKTLNALDYEIRNSESSTNRKILITAVHIINKDTDQLVWYARNLLDCYPHVAQKLITLKLSGLPDLSNEEIDRIFKLASALPQTINSAVKNFTLTKKQIIKHFDLSKPKLNYLQASENFPKSHTRRTNYTLAEIEIISGLVDWGNFTAWGRSLPDTHTFYTADEFASLVKISRHQLRLVIRNRLIETVRGRGLAVLIKRDELTRFKNQFMTIHSLSVQLRIPVQTLRNHIREKFPEAKSTGDQALDLLLVCTEHAEFLIRDGIQQRSPSRREQARASWAKRKNTMPFIEEPCENWISVRQAAVILKMGRSTVTQWINKGLFTDLGVGKMGEHLIPSDQILKFRSQYMTSNETSEFLNLPKRDMNSLLFLDGLRPVTGPLVDNSRLHLYLRADVKKYANEIKNLDNSHHPRWLSITAAKTSLRATEMVFRNLMSSPYFSEHVKRLRNSTYIAREVVEKFHSNYMLIGEIAQHLKLQPIEAKNIIFATGVAPIRHSLIDVQGIAIYRRTDILKILSSGILASANSTTKNISQVVETQSRKHIKPKHTAQINNPNYVLANHIIETLSISKSAFDDIFVKSGYITPIIHSYEKYLDREMIQKVESITKNYYTCSQADKVLGRPGRTRYLILSKTLHEEHPLPNCTHRFKLVSKTEVHRLAIAFYGTGNLP